MDKLKFALATPGDEAVLKQFLTVNELVYQDIEPAGLQHFLMARLGDDVTGTVGLQIQADSALVRSLAVKTEYRNKGLATLLVEKIEEYARSLEISSLYLLTETAEEFFKKRGFQPAERLTAPAGIQSTAEFKDLCPASAAFMVKNIARG